VLRVRLIFRRARDLLLAHFVLALSCHIVALSSLSVDWVCFESGKTEQGGAIGAPSKRISFDICSIERDDVPAAGIIPLPSKVTSKVIGERRCA
jgi:hypothetical protein